MQSMVAWLGGLRKAQAAQSRRNSFMAFAEITRQMITSPHRGFTAAWQPEAVRL